MRRPHATILGAISDAEQGAMTQSQTTIMLVALCKIANIAERGTPSDYQERLTSHDVIEKIAKDAIRDAGYDTAALTSAASKAFG